MKIAGLQIKVERNAVYAFCVMVTVFTIATGVLGLASGDVRDMTLLDVFFVALAAASFHFLAQTIHLIGHAIAAWAVGYPTSGMLFLYVFAMSVYPTDESTLPDRTHIQRSLGGVVAFGLVLCFVLALWVSARNAPQWTIRYLTSYMLLNVALMFTVSALISDGVLFIAQKGWRNQPPEGAASL